MNFERKLIRARRRRFSFTFIALVVASVLLVANVGAFAQQKITISVAIPWGDTTAFNGVFAALKEAYEEMRPDVEIEYLTGWGGDKTLAALAGGVLPDIVFGWGNTDEMREVYLPLDEMMARNGVRLDDYLVGAVGQMHIMGKTWVLQVFVDPNFPLIYNKTLFTQAGLDPEAPPKTVAEFDAMFPKLTRREADGRITQIAMHTWLWRDSYQGFNALTFGSAFGGTLWEGTETEGRLGLATPRMAAAYEWLKGYEDLYRADAASLSLSGWMGAMPQGHQAMTYSITPDLKRLKTLLPMHEFSVAPPFHEETQGFEYPVWFGGWPAGVSVHSRHPEEAFDFLVFMSYSPEGQEILARVGELFPSTKESPGFVALIEENPDWLNFINALKASTLSPATYWLNIPWGEAFAHVNHRVFNEGIAPIIALQEAEEMLIIEARELGLTIL